MKGYAVSREACAQVAERLDLGARLAGEGRATGGEAASSWPATGGSWPPSSRRRSAPCT
jgi:hypothetical protein